MLATVRDLLAIIVLFFCALILHTVCTKEGLFVEINDKIYHLSVGNKPSIARAKDPS